MRWGVLLSLLLCTGCIQQRRVTEKAAPSSLRGSAYCFVAGVEIEGAVVPMEGCTPSYKLCRRAQWTAEKYGGYANVTWLSECTFTFKDVGDVSTVRLRDCGAGVRAENDIGNAAFGGVLWRRRKIPCN